MSEKKLVWDTTAIVNGGDSLWDWHVQSLIKNDYSPSITVDNCSGYAEFLPAAANKMYYAIVGINNAGGAPFNMTKLATVTTDAELSTFLDEYRNDVWMSLGGQVVFNEANEGELRQLEFDAKSKRSLSKGEELVLVTGIRNHGSASATGVTVTRDMTVFYH